MARTTGEASTTYSIRRAEVEDLRMFSDLVNDQGGQAVFRATFGQFNYANLVEYTYLALVATVSTSGIHS